MWVNGLLTESVRSIHGRGKGEGMKRSGAGRVVHACAAPACQAVSQSMSECEGAFLSWTALFSLHYVSFSIFLLTPAANVEGLWLK